MHLARLKLILLSLYVFWISSTYSVPISATGLEAELLGKRAPTELLILQNWLLYQRYLIVSQSEHWSPREIPASTCQGTDVSTSSRILYRFKSSATFWMVELTEPLGSGTYGDVYSAILWEWNTCESRWVAMSDDGPVVAKRTKHTVDSGALLRGSEMAYNIHSGYFLRPKTWFYVPSSGGQKMGLSVMPKAIGDLTSVMQTETWASYTIKMKNELFFKILLGVRAIHSQGIMHRDLKPANILVFAQNTPKIADWDFMTSAATSKDWVVGTTGYIAPEIIRTQEYSKSVDIFALGMILLDIRSFGADSKRMHQLLLWKEIIGSGETSYSYLDMNNLWPHILTDLDENDQYILSHVLCGPNNRWNIDEFIKNFGRLL